MPIILMVDDDPHIRELLQVLLMREGMTVIDAKDGEKALAILDKRKVDLIILDIMMPKMDG